MKVVKNFWGGTMTKSKTRCRNLNLLNINKGTITERTSYNPLLVGANRQLKYPILHSCNNGRKCQYLCDDWSVKDCQIYGRIPPHYIHYFANCISETIADHFLLMRIMQLLSLPNRHG